MFYTAEHLALAFFVGLVIGVISTLIGTKKDLNKETIVSLLVIAVWLSMHGYGFLFEVSVPWLIDFAGFGAAGTFTGISIAEMRGITKEVKSGITNITNHKQ